MSLVRQKKGNQPSFGGHYIDGRASYGRRNLFMSDGPINSPTRGRGSSEVAPAQEPGSDRLLLQRFAARHDEAAFAALVERHGPMVLAVCRRVLRDAHEAEDACQATFLVLARKAGSVRQPELLGNWLYGVANRVARRAQRRAAASYARAMRGATMQATESTPDDVVWEDLRRVLDGELDRLPKKYRSAVVLCYLEGLSAEEAARQLRCPRGTILSRLARARDKLRKRLVRRGLALSAGLLAVLLTQNCSASEALAMSFICATARAARAFAARRPGGPGVQPGRPAALATWVLRSMLLSKWKGAALGLLAAGIILTGVVWSLLPGRAADQTGPGAAAGNGAAVNNEPDPRNNVAGKKDDAVKDDQDLLEGAWPGISQEINGQVQQLGPGKGVTFTFTRDKVHVLCTLFDAWNKDFGYRLNSQAHPKTIDMFSLDPAANGRVELVGIYELKGDTFKMCFSTPENGRPTEFAAKGNHFIWVFQREPANKEKELPKNP
jgi:RNA polymerase sigma factor (sigma-70 family)